MAGTAVERWLRMNERNQILTKGLKMLTVTDAAEKELEKYAEKNGNKCFEVVFNGFG